MAGGDASGTGWTETRVALAGGGVHVARAGRGRPLLVLHHEIGTPDRLPLYDRLAERFDVIVPHHPGFGRSKRPAWMRSVRDVAVIHRGLLAEFGVEKPLLLGLGFGGWIAAEMATMAPRDLAGLVLVGAMGIKPPEGHILDQALMSYIDYARAGFHTDEGFAGAFGAEPSTDQLEQWDVCREMSFRIAWKPYMHSQTLPHLLGSVKAPSLVVWGEHDAVVPISAGRVYAEKLPGARLEIVPGCGHCVDMEKPDELARLVINVGEQIQANT